MGVVDTSWSSVPDDIQTLLRGYIQQVKKKGGDHIQSVILYGSVVRGDYVPTHSNINVLLVLSVCDVGLLQKVGSWHRRWGKEGMVAPLVLTEWELRQSLDVFPLEYFEIKEHHLLLAGRDPFSSLPLNESNLLIQCRQGIIGNLFRVRQRFLEGLARPEAIRTLLPISLMALVPCLRGLFRLMGYASGGTTEVFLQRLSDQLSIETKALQEVLNMKQGLSTPGTIELPRLYERYLKAVQNLFQWMEDSRADDESRFKK